MTDIKVPLVNDDEVLRMPMTEALEPLTDVDKNDLQASYAVTSRTGLLPHLGCVSRQDGARVR